MGEKHYIYDSKRRMPQSMSKIMRKMTEQKNPSIITGYREYEDMMIVYVEFYPIYLFDILCRDFLQFIYERDPHPIERLYYRIMCDKLEEYDLACFFAEEEWDGIFAIDFKRKYVYDKEYRIVLSGRQRVTLNPVFRNKQDSVVKYILVNDDKVKDFKELETVISRWFERIKKNTDLLVPEKYRKGDTNCE